MFSLIITIISIALVVALVGATMYYGGDALSQGRTSADAAAYVSGAQQIGAAGVMYFTNEGAAPAVIADLTGKNMLGGIPNVKTRTATAEWTFVTTPVRAVTIALGADKAGSDANSKLCEQINKNAGATTAEIDATTGTIAAMGTYAYACVPGTVPATDAAMFSFKY